jgi:outer membrane biosynthesis protein TonB
MLSGRRSRSKPVMRYSLRLGIAVWLMTMSFALAQSGAASTERSQEPSASRPNTPEPKQPETGAAGLGGVDVLSDTLGVDFGPYLQRVIKTVRQNWYHLTPPSARAPKMTRGVVSIEFAILKNGKVKGMKLVEMTVDVRMAAAAWHGITDTRFPPLPAEFSANILPFV